MKFNQPEKKEQKNRDDRGMKPNNTPNTNKPQ